MKEITMGQQIGDSLGIYLHIPFCIRKCGYCDFLSAAASKEQRAEYVQALLAEIKSWDGTTTLPVDSIFFGGGTPSLLSGDQVKELMQSLSHTFQLSQNVEVTLECNPGTIEKEKLKGYQNAGINRLSIGLQSADNEELKLLGRIHTWEEFLENYFLAREIGFSNINIDLMSALPGQTKQRFEETLNKTAALIPEHISVYSLILEEGTPFYERYASGKGLLSEEADRELYARTKELLSDYGYYRYEISNYALPGKECRHNNRYWRREEYLGLGLGASSFFQGKRWKNTSDIKEYQSHSDSLLPLRQEVECPTREEAMGEWMFLGLRRTQGVSKQKFYDCFQVHLEEIYQEVLQKMKNCGCLEETEEFVRLTQRGIDVSNSVMCEFLL